MHPQLRAFLVANGLRADASEKDAWEFHKQLLADGVTYNGPERAEQPAGGEGQGTEDAQGAQRAAAGARQHGDGGEPAPATQPGLTTADVQRELAADRERCRSIEDVCSVAGMDADQARAYIDEGLNADQVREKVFAYLRSNNIPIGAGAHQAPHVGTESRDKFRSAVVDGLILRSGRRIETPAPGANEFRGQRMADIARECLERAGVSVRGLNPDEIARRALSASSSSDFPTLMSNVANRNLQESYLEAQATYRPWVAVGDASDFKSIYAVKLSNSPDLESLNENGEIKTAALTEGTESYSVVTKAIRIPFTRVMIVNDDLKAFTRVPVLIGAAAKRMENRMVYSLLVSNPTMNDGVALFHASHSNLQSAGDLVKDVVSGARAAMRKQTGMNDEPLDIVPAFILAGTDEETTADILFRSPSLPVADYSAGVVNPLAGKMTPITDPALDVAEGDNPFYILASPNQSAVIEVSWLLGQETPFVDEEMQFGTGNIDFVCRHDFGCGVVDHVGAQKVPRS